jgi:hypothetical protein
MSQLKVKLSLFLNKYHAMKAYGGVEVQLHVLLISATDGGEWSLNWFYQDVEKRTFYEHHNFHMSVNDALKPWTV